MTFLNPLVLLGLAAAAIPLLIHLFNFRKPRQVDFSTLAFLKELQRSTMRRVRVKQWLLLALRTLAILCLVLAFARPAVEGAWAGLFGGRVPTSMAVVIDNSLSMTQRDAQGDYLGQARDLAAALAESLEPGDELVLVPTAPTENVQPASFSTAEPALDAIEQLEAAPGARTLTNAIAQAASLLEDAANLNREIVVVTDAQQATLVDSTGIGIPDDLALTLLPVGAGRSANVAVTDARVESRIVEAGQPVRLSATLVNYSDAPLDDVAVRVLLDGQAVAETAASLAPGVPTTVPLTATPPTRGWLAGTVKIEADAFEADDVRHFALHVPATRRLLVVQGDGQRADLVALALTVADDRTAFDVTTIPEASLPAASLDAYDGVVLVGPATLSSGETAALARYAEAGGGLLVFPGDNTGDLSTLLGALGGGRFAGTVGQEGGPPIGSFDRVDTEHPLFDGIFSADDTQRRLEQPDVFFAATYAPGGGTEQTLIALPGGRPFLQEVRHGQGTALVYAVAPDPAWSDFSVRGLFVPLLYRSAFYLAQNEDDEATRFTVGELATLRLGGVREGTPVRLVAPEDVGSETVPEQRALPGALLVDVPPEAIPAPGVYDVRQGNTLLRRIAANLDARESNLTRLDATDARDALAEATGRPVRLLDAAGGAGLRAAEQLQTERAGIELWKTFLWVALAFLVAEMLVAMRWRSESVQV
ncbi:MAG: BatA domain-containing protein [Bacteroidota bacterium]